MKTVLETGWFSGNSSLGAPFGASFLDFARPEMAFLLFHRLAGAFTSNVALVHNLFYFAGFPLVAWSALAVLRGELRVAWPLAVAGAVTFCWLPYHFLRIEHLFLSNYMVVPVAAWLMLRVRRPATAVLRARAVGAGGAARLAGVALLASTSLYYAFFAIVLICAGGVLES